MLVNHLGLTLTKEDLQNVVDLMEPYGQISNGIELLNPPLDVRNYFGCQANKYHFVFYMKMLPLSFTLQFFIFNL